MASDPLDDLRLSLMQDVLPVGMAVVERARKGGPQGVIEAFTTSPDPLTQLKQEGDSAAKRVRENLDRLQPGLGNPVVKVTVRDVPEEREEDSADLALLQQTLGRISDRLVLLEQRLDRIVPLPSYLDKVPSRRHFVHGIPPTTPPRRKSQRPCSLNKRRDRELAGSRRRTQR